jgi:hypothetical protein
MKARLASGVIAALALTLVVSPQVADAAPVVGANVQHTVDADFDKGTLVNVNHDAPNGNQLQLNSGQSGTFKFIWVALSGRCTIAKINTETGAILAEYRSLPQNKSCTESSRTTVAFDGSSWVGHRGPGGATHVALNELNQCIDRNGNGVIDTSTGYDDIKAWPSGDASNAEDECILHHVDLGWGDTRHISVAPNGDIVLGSYVTRAFQAFNNSTGAAIPGAGRDSVACGGYGGLVDKSNVLWSANGGGSGLLRWDRSAPDSVSPAPFSDAPGANPRCIQVPVYGLGLDPNNGNIWVSTLSTPIYRVSPDGNTIAGPFNHGHSTQGLAVGANGHVWLSSSIFCGGSNCPITHLLPDGSLVGDVPNPNGAGSTGVAIDAEGKVWSANRNSNTATRIDPSLGGPGADGVTPLGAVDLVVSFPFTNNGSAIPYNYSDMTGSVALGGTAPQGTWTVVQDGGANGFNWNKIGWNTEAQGNVPAGASITVEARVADSEAGLGGQSFTTIANGTAFSLNGRFIQVRVTLKPSPSGAGPVLSDIRVQGGSNDRTVPACTVSRVSPSEINLSFVDSGSGLQSIDVSGVSNADVVVPPFTPGTTSPVVVNAKRIDTTTSGRVTVKATDVAGNRSYCSAGGYVIV